VEGHIAALAARTGDLDAVDRACYVDTRSYLVDNCLVKSDRMSMACSLELRVPLLDKELVELAFGVPSRLKATASRTAVSISRWDVTPTFFRNLRMLMLKASSFMEFLP
jgi:asparagine synthase (glutamine-hydrolysing)